MQALASSHRADREVDTEEGKDGGSPRERRRRRRWWYLLFAIPFIAVLWPGFYNQQDAPALMGIPFFFWYQVLWVVISAVLTMIVYLASE